MKHVKIIALSIIIFICCIYPVVSAEVNVNENYTNLTDNNINLASQNNFGKEITIERLTEIFIELQNKKANNINLVTPTHYVPQIIEAIKIAKENGIFLFSQ